MIKTILVPLDGSALAERVLPYAEALAQPLGARLLLLRAAWPGGRGNEEWVKARARLEGEAEVYLFGVSSRLAEKGLTAEAVVSFDDPATGITEQIRQSGADLVVMATHGRSGLGRWVYGSVAEAVLAHCPVPLLLVRAWQTEDKEPAIALHPRLLVPLDGSPFAEAALPVAERIARLLHGQVILLRAVHMPENVVGEKGTVVVYADQQLESLNAEAQRNLRDAAERLANDGSVVEHEFDVRVGEPAEAIAAAGEEHGASLVVMATHGRTGLSRLLMGSVAGAVLRQGNLPLLLVRPAHDAPERSSAE